jgi:hypothetical protein
VNPQQVLPGAIVSLEAEALRDLERGDDATFDLLAALACPVASVPVLSAGLVEVRCELVGSCNILAINIL